MAEEEKKEGDTPEEAAEGEAKPSFIAKLLGSKLIIPIAMVVGLAAGGGVVFLLVGHKEEAPAPVAVEGHASPAESAKEGEHAPKDVKPTEETAGPTPSDIEDLDEDVAQKQDFEASSGEGGAENPDDDTADIQENLLVKLDGLVVNLFEKNSIHYLKIGISILVDNEAVVEEMRVNSARLRDKLLFIFSDTTLREVLTSGGKALIKEDILATFNKFLKKGKVKRVYFTDFTVQ